MAELLERYLKENNGQIVLEGFLPNHTNCPNCGAKLTYVLLEYLTRKCFREICPICNYSQEISSLKNHIKRTNSKITKWANKVKEKAENKCFICGSDIDCEAHHIVPVSWSIKYKYDKNNGVCLCKKCHWNIHHKNEGRMENTGFIKLYRSMLDWEWYDDVNTKVLFLHLLLRANYKESKYRGFDIPIGSVVVGLRELAKQTNLSVQNVRTSLEKLKKTGEINTQVTHDFTIVNIVKFRDFQDLEKFNQHTTNTQLTHNQHTTNTQLTQSKESKKVRKEEYIYIYPPMLDNDNFKSTWETYREHRKEIKHKLTPKAEQMALNKLAKMAKTCDEAIEIIENSIANGWQGLFPLRNTGYNTKRTEIEEVDLLGNPFEDILPSNKSA